MKRHLYDIADQSCINIIKKNRLTNVFLSFSSLPLSLGILSFTNACKPVLNLLLVQARFGSELSLFHFRDIGVFDIFQEPLLKYFNCSFIQKIIDILIFRFIGPFLLLILIDLNFDGFILIFKFSFVLRISLNNILNDNFS